jgi:hypothetical protein
MVAYDVLLNLRVCMVAYEVLLNLRVSTIVVCFSLRVTVLLLFGEGFWVNWDIISHSCSQFSVLFAVSDRSSPIWRRLVGHWSTCRNPNSVAMFAHMSPELSL